MFVGPQASFLVQKLGDTMVLPSANRKAAVAGMFKVKKLENVLSCPTEQLGLDIDSRILRQSDTG